MRPIFDTDRQRWLGILAALACLIFTGCDSPGQLARSHSSSAHLHHPALHETVPQVPSQLAYSESQRVLKMVC